MRIRVLLKAEGIESYPQHPNYPLNVAIYQLMSIGNKPLADKIHNEGYECDGRFYRPFCFTRPEFENARHINLEKGKQIFVNGYANWLISTPFDEIMEAILDGMAKRKSVKIGETEFPIKAIDYEPEPKFSEEEVFWALSPIVVPIAAPDKPYNRYLNPLQPEFYEKLAGNAYRKLKLLTGKEYNIEFSMHNPEKYNEEKALKIGQYLDSQHLGYMFPLKVKGDPEALRKLYDFGVGALNCQGYGMVANRLLA
ncbi:MAG: CRISPR-associated endoribonuclease Cas6 [Thermosipho sp. (in: Bacteria)]|nr:CRISPR-associated endoribonuclease Cas6 [Thermosipho sp. (in: thermotogales)]